MENFAFVPNEQLAERRKLLGARWRQKDKFPPLSSVLGDLDWIDLQDLIPLCLSSKCMLSAVAPKLPHFRVPIFYAASPAEWRVSGNIIHLFERALERDQGLELNYSLTRCNLVGPDRPDPVEVLTVTAHELGHKVASHLEIAAQPTLENELQAWAIGRLLLRRNFGPESAIWPAYARLQLERFASYVYADRFLLELNARCEARPRFVNYFCRDFYLLKYRLRLLRRAYERIVRAVADETASAIRDYRLSSEEERAVEQMLPITFELDIFNLSNDELPA